MINRRSFLKGAALATALSPTLLATAEEIQSVKKPASAPASPVTTATTAPSERWVPGNFDVALLDRDGVELPELNGYRRVRGDTCPPSEGVLPIRAVFPMCTPGGWPEIHSVALYVRETVDVGRMILKPSSEPLYVGALDNGPLSLHSFTTLQLETVLHL